LRLTAKKPLCDQDLGAMVWFWPPCAPPGPTPGRVMFVVGGVDVPGAIAGPGAGAGDAGSALTGPMPKVIADRPIPAATTAALAIREMFIVLGSSTFDRADEQSWGKPMFTLATPRR
jgi:hypothetical protein